MIDLHSSIRLTDSGRWYVYGLYDSFHKDPFYIGMAKNVVLRGAQHMYSTGPVRVRVREIVAAKGYVYIGVIGVYDTAKEAAHRERIAIRAYPELVNRELYALPKPKPPKEVQWNRHKTLGSDAEKRSVMKARWAEVLAAEGLLSEAEDRP